MFQPYFLISIKGNSTQIQEVETYLNRRFEGLISEVEMISKIDLDVPNHLSGSKSHFMKVKFRNVQDLMAVRKILLPRIQANKAARESHETYGDEDTSKTTNVMDTLVDIREYDVPYVTRVTIDTGYRVGLWYDVQAVPGSVGINLVERKDLEQRPLMKTMVDKTQHSLTTTSTSLCDSNQAHLDSIYRFFHIFLRLLILKRPSFRSSFLVQTSTRS